MVFERVPIITLSRCNLQKFQPEMKGNNSDGASQSTTNTTDSAKLVTSSKGNILSQTRNGLNKETPKEHKDSTIIADTNNNAHNKSMENGNVIQCLPDAVSTKQNMKCLSLTPHQTLACFKDQTWSIQHSNKLFTPPKTYSKNASRAAVKQDYPEQSVENSERKTYFKLGSDLNKSMTHTEDMGLTVVDDRNETNFDVNITSYIPQSRYHSYQNCDESELSVQSNLMGVAKQQNEIEIEYDIKSDLGYNTESSTSREDLTQTLKDDEGRLSMEVVGMNMHDVPTRFTFGLHSDVLDEVGQYNEIREFSNCQNHNKMTDLSQNNDNESQRESYESEYSPSFVEDLHEAYLKRRRSEPICKNSSLATSPLPVSPFNLSNSGEKEVAYEKIRDTLTSDLTICARRPTFSKTPQKFRAMSLDSFKLDKQSLGVNILAPFKVEKVRVVSVESLQRQQLGNDKQKIILDDLTPSAKPDKVGSSGDLQTMPVGKSNIDHHKLNDLNDDQFESSDDQALKSENELADNEQVAFEHHNTSHQRKVSRWKRRLSLPHVTTQQYKNQSKKIDSARQREILMNLLAARMSASVRQNRRRFSEDVKNKPTIEEILSESYREIYERNSYLYLGVASATSCRNRRRRHSVDHVGSYRRKLKMVEDLSDGFHGDTESICSTNDNEGMKNLLYFYHILFY